MDFLSAGAEKKAGCGQHQHYTGVCGYSLPHCLWVKQITYETWALFQSFLILQIIHLRRVAIDN